MNAYVDGSFRRSGAGGAAAVLVRDGVMVGEAVRAFRYAGSSLVMEYEAACLWRGDGGGARFHG